MIDDKYPIREGDDMDMENSISLKRLISLGKIQERQSSPNLQDDKGEEEERKSSARFLTDPRVVESEH